jgi:DNA-binding CsgD family transcriptional regulator
MEPAGVDPERQEPLERSERTPSSAKDDGSSATEAPGPGVRESEEYLDLELAVRFGPRMTNLASQAPTTRRDRSFPDQPSSIFPDMDILERAPVLLELSHLLHGAAGGRGRVVFVGGEAGIGKTALVRRFTQMAEGSARILWGACDPLSTPRPLGPLLDMQKTLGSKFADLVTHGADKDTLFRSFLVELSGRRRASLVIFEDVHWADEGTLDLLRFLARRLESEPALLIATYRDDEVGDRHPLRVVLGDLATLPAVRRIALEPLSLAAVRTLAADTSLDPVRLHEQTAGNPFFVTEILAAGGERLPATVRDAVLARAARLSPAARDALDAAAVLGFRFEPWLLEAVAEPAGGAIDACLASGMLRGQDDRLAFGHELTREAILGVFPPHRALAVHRAALAALRRLPPGAVETGRLAHHAEGAGDAAAVLEYAPRAARRARELNAHRDAAAQFGRALRFAAALPGPERAQLWEEYSWECAATDNWDEAIRADRELVALWRAERDPLKEGWALGFLSRCLITTGANAEAEETSRAAIALLETLPPGPELAEAYAIQAGLRMLNRDNAEAILWARKALDLTEPDGNLRTRIMAYNRLGSAMIVSGDAEGDRYLRVALDLAREAGIHWDAAGAYANLGSGWGEWYDFGHAEAYLAEGIALAEEHELDGQLTYMLSWQALVQLYLGRWAEAKESALRVTQRPAASGIARIMALLALGRLAARAGEPGATELLDDALALARPTGTLQRLAPVWAARAESAWLLGDPDRAGQEARAGVELALRHRHPWLAGELLAWMARAGERVEAEGWIARPFALQIAGAWAEAAAEWERLGCPYEAALALAETNEEKPLRRALAELERLGARPAAQLASRRLREGGARRIPRGPRPSTRENPALLTRRQVEIARLLAAGLQNGEIAQRLYISPKTVDHHVSSVLAKLGVRSRTEAAREVIRLGLQDGEAHAPT